MSSASETYQDQSQFSPLFNLTLDNKGEVLFHLLRSEYFFPVCQKNLENLNVVVSFLSVDKSKKKRQPRFHLITKELHSFTVKKISTQLIGNLSI